MLISRSLYRPTRTTLCGCFSVRATAVKWREGREERDSEWGMKRIMGSAASLLGVASFVGPASPGVLSVVEDCDCVGGGPTSALAVGPDRALAARNRFMSALVFVVFVLADVGRGFVPLLDFINALGRGSSPLSCDPSVDAPACCRCEACSDALDSGSDVSPLAESLE